MLPMLRVSSVCFVILTMISCLGVAHKNDGRIIGGVSSVGMPFLASVGVLPENGNRLHICGGTVWDDETILTAASCLYENGNRMEANKLSIYLGHESLTDIQQTYIFKVNEFKIHPNFSQETKLNDIAVLKLQTKIDFATNHGKAACVCNPEPLSEVRSNCIVMGWGASQPEAGSLSEPNPLKQAVLTLRPDSDCKAENSHFNAEVLLCAGHPGRGTCPGDAGGPLVCPHKTHTDSFVLVGVATVGEKNCGQGASFFARVTSFADWIENPTESLSDPGLIPGIISNPLGSNSTGTIIIVVVGALVVGAIVVFLVQRNGKSGVEAVPSVAKTGARSAKTGPRTAKKVSPAKKVSAVKPSRKYR